MLQVSPRELAIEKFVLLPCPVCVYVSCYSSTDIYLRLPLTNEQEKGEEIPTLLFAQIYILGDLCKPLAVLFTYPLNIIIYKKPPFYLFFRTFTTMIAGAKIIPFSREG